MAKYIVVNPWRKGQQVGEVIETDKLHPVLEPHVKAAPIEVATPAKATPKK